MKISDTKRLYELNKNPESFIDDDGGMDLLHTEDDIEIMVSQTFIAIPEYNLYLRSGVINEWDEEGKLYVPGEYVTVISDTPEINEGDLITYVTGDYVTAVDEWFGGNIPTEQIEQLMCEVNTENL